MREYFRAYRDKKACKAGSEGIAKPAHRRTAKRAPPSPVRATGEAANELLLQQVFSSEAWATVVQANAAKAAAEAAAAASAAQQQGQQQQQQQQQQQPGYDGCDDGRTMEDEQWRLGSGYGSGAPSLATEAAAAPDAVCDHTLVQQHQQPLHQQHPQQQPPHPQHQQQDLQHQQHLRRQQNQQLLQQQTAQLLQQQRRAEDLQRQLEESGQENLLRPPAIPSSTLAPRRKLCAARAACTSGGGGGGSGAAEVAEAWQGAPRRHTAVAMSSATGVWGPGQVQQLGASQLPYAAPPALAPRKQQRGEDQVCVRPGDGGQDFGPLCPPRRMAASCGGYPTHSECELRHKPHVSDGGGMLAAWPHQQQHGVPYPVYSTLGGLHLHAAYPLPYSSAYGGMAMQQQHVQPFGSLYINQHQHYHDLQQYQQYQHQHQHQQEWQHQQQGHQPSAGATTSQAACEVAGLEQRRPEEVHSSGSDSTDATARLYLTPGRPVDAAGGRASSWTVSPFRLVNEGACVLPFGPLEEELGLSSPTSILELSQGLAEGGMLSLEVE
ncbi:hypothetical protein TSOC_005265 [Tetrabaena socialis]|uniref:Uncharacterized protein n=1 Tax=Tetrabaena socialis TaxID=47790 RepID=A0A2J8A6P5_9CHLO|nr:hypothetical protein TSOC_005265 [Tetrabaena socialis]|eukprot:PNH08180.1 hypothetical protein TSOC_005265 [Tetrabaena socialis]